MEVIERKKLEVQLKRIDATIAELEDIQRIEEHIELQRQLEKEVKEKLKT
jgi:hypothetical protein